jgi:cyanophycin synthetase
MPECLRSHIASGGLAVVHEAAADGGDIVLYDDARRLPLMRAAEIPATLEGAAQFNVANALAAVAMTYAQGTAVPVIRRALSSFAPSYAHNPGRLNIHDVDGVRIILDYAHNPASFTALCDVVRRLRPRHRRAIAQVSTPGDRRDEDIRRVGAIVGATFDEIVIREEPERRGRAPGEISRLLREGAASVGASPDRLHDVPGETESLDACLALARPGDLVVVTPASTDAGWRRVLAFQVRHAEPAAAPARVMA